MLSRALALSVAVFPLAVTAAGADSNPVYAPARWSRASLGSTAVARDPKGEWRLIYQGLDVPEGSGDSHWTIGLGRLKIGGASLSASP